jgi:hypothetical protein
MAIEPVVEILLLVVLVMATFWLVGSVSDAKALCAVIVPFELGLACWLLSARLARRHRAQEYVLVELFLSVKGDLARAFPQRIPTAGERVESKTPLLRLVIQDALEMTSETPCKFARAAGAWMAVVLAVTTVEQWVWQTISSGRTVDLAAAALVGPSLAVFVIVWNDLRRGRLRSLLDPRRVRSWSEGYRPEQVATVLPSAPVLLLLVVPVLAVGVNWSATGSWSSHLSVTEAVFGLWLLAWNGRGAAASSTFQRLEQRAAPIDRLVRRGLTPAWDLLSRVCRWSGWGSAALLTLAWSRPASFPAWVAPALSETASWLLAVCLCLGLLVLNSWRRPVSPCTCSAQDLLRRQGETQIRRVSVFLNVCLGSCMLLIAVGGGLI